MRRLSHAHPLSDGTTIRVVVIPLLNEAENVTPLYERLVEAAQRADGPWEFILVDDGSDDSTWEAVAALHRKDLRVKGIRLTQRFGQTDAIACGIRHAKGEVIVTMDGDLQNDPADIPRLIAPLADYDVVCGWRKQRRDAFWYRTVPSVIANWLIGWLTGVRLHDCGCSLKAYRASVIKQTPLYAEFHRFIPALTVLTGAAITELPVRHYPRLRGRTKYSLARAWRVTLDMVTVAFLLRCSANPLRFFGWIAAVALTAGTGFGVLVVRSYLNADTGLQILPGITVLLLWFAGQAFVMGLFSELQLASAAFAPPSTVETE